MKDYPLAERPAVMKYTPTTYGKTGDPMVDLSDPGKEWQLLALLSQSPGLIDEYAINAKIFSEQVRKDILEVIKNEVVSSVENCETIIVDYLVKRGYERGYAYDQVEKIALVGYVPEWWMKTILTDLNELHARRVLVQVGYSAVEKAYQGETADLNALRQGIDKLEREKAELTPAKDYYTAEEIGAMTFPPINFLVEGILPPGLCFLAGRPKAGKSWLALQIAYAVAQGQLVIGRKARAGTVVIYALEDNLRRLNWRTTAQAWNFTRLTNIRFKLLDSFIDLAKAGDDLARSDMVIVDTFTRATGHDQFDPVAMRGLLSPLQAAAISQDKVVMVIDHMPKPKGRDNYDNVIYDLYGSISKAGIADTILGLYRDAEGASGKLSGTGRDIEDFEIDLIWDKDGFRWDAVAPGTVIDRLGYSDNRHAILSTIVEAEDISQLDIASVTGMNKGTVSRTLNELVSSGYVLKYVDGKRVLYQPSVTGRVDILPQWEGRADAAGRILQGVLVTDQAGQAGDGVSKRGKNV